MKEDENRFFFFFFQQIKGVFRAKKNSGETASFKKIKTFSIS